MQEVIKRLFIVLTLSTLLLVIFVKSSIPFRAIQSNEATLPDNTVTIIATGDVMLGRAVNQKSVRLNNFAWPFEKTADLLKSADITLINLEGPIINNCTPTNVGMIFCADAKSIDGLKSAGIDIANLANNHIGNHGEKGLGETKKLLENKGILFSGIGQIAFKEVKGVKFAFLGYNDIPPRVTGISWANNEDIVRDIKRAKESDSVVIVSFHWGVEYTDSPTKRQKELAHLAVDSGADLVIGNHPHWFQPIETYKDKVIVYSHGNFVFDQMWSKRTEEGIVGKYTFSGRKLTNVELIPVIIDNLGQPRIAERNEKNNILEQMKKESSKLKSTTP